jgi:hypothetical protein
MYISPKVSMTPSPGKWTPDGTYSTRSAYRAQFRGSFTKFHRDLIWKALTENKCKVFVWILIHGKLLMADNLEKRGWPHEEHCVLCNGPLETGLHLRLCCPFAKVIWSQILSLLGQQQNDWSELSRALCCVDEKESQFQHRWVLVQRPKIFYMMSILSPIR